VSATAVPPGRDGLDKGIGEFALVASQNQLRCAFSLLR
jgi:hypothetical protein